MKVLQYLLENGGCSIKYRIKREIFQEDKNSEEMIALQNKILKRRKVQQLFAKQHEDGWIGNELHGGVGQGLDSSISFLLSSGVEKDCRALHKAVESILNLEGDKPYRTTFKGGDALDLGGRGGNNAIKAGVLADLDEERNPIVQQEIDISLAYLKKSLSYEAIDDFSVLNKKGVRYYKPGAQFPGSNHINLLSATQCWRNAENYELVKTALEHCMEILKYNDHNIMFKSDSHFVGPFNFNWGFVDFSMDDLERDSYAFVWWLRILYKLSKIGIIRDSAKLREPYDYLYELVVIQDIINEQTDLSRKRFKDILSIEENWRNNRSMLCDINFYCIMILHNAGYDLHGIEI